MIFQISAGQGPEECELEAGRIFEALQKEFPQIVKISGKTGTIVLKNSIAAEMAGKM